MLIYTSSPKKYTQTITTNFGCDLIKEILLYKAIYKTVHKAPRIVVTATHDWLPAIHALSAVLYQGVLKRSRPKCSGASLMRFNIMMGNLPVSPRVFGPENKFVNNFS